MCKLINFQTEGTLQRRQNPNKYKEEDLDFKPKINRDIPKFDQLQQEFDEKLQSKKKAMPKTQFQPFEFMVSIKFWLTLTLFTEKRRKLERDLTNRGAETA